jgi:hypothetical protein
MSWRSSSRRERSPGRLATGKAIKSKSLRVTAARVVAVVHAQQADHLKGDGPHGHEVQKVTPPARKALVQAGRFHRLQPGRRATTRDTLVDKA